MEKFFRNLYIIQAELKLNILQFLPQIPANYFITSSGSTFSPSCLSNIFMWVW